MRKLFVLISAATALVSAAYVTTVRATPSSLYSGTTLAVGRFGPMDVTSHAVVTEDGTHPTVWLSQQKTRGISDVYIQNNVWQPGGSTGWHSHPGHSLIIVTEGTLTVYDADDPTCQPQLYEPGMGLVDKGGDDAHLIRNEGTVIAKTIAVQTLPRNAPRRIDEPAPAGCPL